MACPESFNSTSWFTCHAAPLHTLRNLFLNAPQVGPTIAGSFVWTGTNDTTSLDYRMAGVGYLPVSWANFVDWGCGIGSYSVTI